MISPRLLAYAVIASCIGSSQVAAIAPSACHRQFLEALTAAPIRATSFCHSFTTTTTHKAYPSFVFDYCNIATFNEGPLDRELSSVCSTFAPASKKPSATPAHTTDKTSPVRSITSSSKTSAKTSGLTHATSGKTSTATSGIRSSSRTPSKLVTVSTPKASILPGSLSISKSIPAGKSSAMVPGKGSITSLKPSSGAVSRGSTSLPSRVSKSSTRSSSALAGKISGTSSRSSLTQSLTRSSSSIPAKAVTSSSSTTLTTSSTAGTTSTASSTITSPSSAATLFAAIHWDTNLTDYDNIIPSNSSALYYAEQAGLADPYLKHRYLQMNANYNYPTVVYEHSSHFLNITCYNLVKNTAFPYEDGTTEMTLVVDGITAQNLIDDTWPLYSDMVLITPGDGCDFTSTNSTRTYWLGNYGGASEDHKKELLVTFRGDQILVEEGITDADLVWGTYNPSANTTTAEYYNTTEETSFMCGYNPDSNYPDFFYMDPCTVNFDLALDEKIGYQYSIDFVSASAYAGAVYTALNLPAQIAAQEAQAAASAQQQDDGFWSSIAQSFETFVDNAVTDVVNYIESWIPTIPDGDISLEIAPTDLVDSPWGDAFQIYKYPDDDDSESSSEKVKRIASTDLEVRTLEKAVTIYCVNCGVNGTLDVEGSASFSTGVGVTALTVGFTGSFSAGINIGIDAEVEWSKNYTKQLAQTTPSFLTIPDLITIGPIFTLDAEIDLDIKAEGTILTGASMEIGPFAANLDFFNTGNTYAEGFDNITFEKYFEASGEVSASATLSLPISIGFGIEIFPLKFKEEIAIVDKPGIEASITFQDSVSSGDTSNAPSSSDGDDDDCEGGIKWGVDLVNELDLDIFGWNNDLWDYKSDDLAGGCYQLGTAGNASSTKYANAVGVSTNATNVTSLIDSTGSFTMFSAPDGNVYLQSAKSGSTTYWQNDTSTLTLEDSLGDVLVADAAGRSMYFFTDTLSTLGVSRLRVLTDDAVPSTAERFVWGYGDIDNNATTPDQYFGATSYQANGEYTTLMPVACNMLTPQGVNVTKIFMMFNEYADVAMHNLMEPALQDMITGGNVTGCIYLLWQPWQVA